MKQKVSVENIFQKKQYKSILNLLIDFQNKEFQGCTGLRPIQFRYPLEKGYKDTLDPKNRRKLKEFFGSRLDVLIKRGSVVPDCITSRNTLSQFLRTLKDPPLNAIVSTGRHMDIRYRIVPDFYYQGLQLDNINVLRNFNHDQIQEIVLGIAPSHIKFIVYGFDNMLRHKYLSEETKTKIDRATRKIIAGYTELHSCKVGTIAEICKKELIKFRRETKSVRLKELIPEDAIHRELALYHIFYYPFSIAFFDLVEKNNGVKPTRKEISSFVHKMCSDPQYNILEPEDIEEIVDFGCRNADFFTYAHPWNAVAVSLYQTMDEPFLARILNIQTEE